MSKVVPLNPHNQPGAERVPIVGQPFTVISMQGIPIDVVLKCNCGGLVTEVRIVQSQPAACPTCRRQYAAVFNPATSKLEFRLGIPEPKESS
jgi:hypothetical protein